MTESILSTEDNLSWLAAVRGLGFDPRSTGVLLLKERDEDGCALVLGLRCGLGVR